MDKEKKEFGAWWIWVLVLLVVAVAVLGGLNALGVIGETVVQREVFERSFQYTEAQRQKIATYEAQLAELEVRLKSADEDTAADIEAQMAAIRVRLDAEKRKSK